MQTHVNLVDLVKRFPTNILLQNLASIQKRTSPIKFVHSAEESEKGSISNLSTKVRAATKRSTRAGPKALSGSAWSSASSVASLPRSCNLPNSMPPGFAFTLTSSQGEVQNVLYRCLFTENKKTSNIRERHPPHTPHTHTHTHTCKSVIRKSVSPKTRHRVPKVRTQQPTTTHQHKCRIMDQSF